MGVALHKATSNPKETVSTHNLTVSAKSQPLYLAELQAYITTINPTIII